MTEFRYLAGMADGSRRSGALDAQDADGAVRLLARQGLFAIRVEAAAGTFPGGLAVVPARPGRRARRAEVNRLLRQLATFLGAGFPLSRALDHAGGEGASPAQRELAAHLRHTVGAGVPFHQACAKHLPAGDPVLIGLLTAGEAAGKLAEACGQVADLRERQDDQRREILAAMVYPGMMLAAMTVAVAVLTGFVLPRFAGMFAELGTALPLPTVILLAISDGVVHWWWAMAGAGAVMASMVAQAWGEPRRRERLLAVPEMLPLFGPLLRSARQGRVAQALAMLLESGVPLPRALAAIEGLAGASAHTGLSLAQDRLAGGRPLAEALAAGRLFDATLIDLVRLGEESGRLPEVLRKAAAIAEREVAGALRLLARVVEPVLIIVMGVVVGGIVAAMILPIIELDLGVPK